jgi:hypothetical protein
MNWLDGDHVVTPTEATETVFSMGSVQNAYKRNEFRSQFSSGQLQVVVDRKSGS